MKEIIIILVGIVFMLCVFEVLELTARLVNEYFDDVDHENERED